jgi:hypothetical protein
LNVEKDFRLGSFVHPPVFGGADWSAPSPIFTLRQGEVVGFAATMPGEAIKIMKKV